MRRFNEIDQTKVLMRIITGSLKSGRLKYQKLDVRPTTDRTKESIFNKLKPINTLKVQVLDLFAGSGNLGFGNERCSRSTCD